MSIPALAKVMILFGVFLHIKCIDQVDQVYNIGQCSESNKKFDVTLKVSHVSNNKVWSVDFVIIKIAYKISYILTYTYRNDMMEKLQYFSLKL